MGEDRARKKDRGGRENAKEGFAKTYLNPLHLENLLYYKEVFRGKETKFAKKISAHGSVGYGREKNRIHP